MTQGKIESALLRASGKNKSNKISGLIGFDNYDVPMYLTFSKRTLSGALIVGRTGAGKTNLLNNWILSVMHEKMPNEVIFTMINGHGHTFEGFQNSPFVEAVLDYDMDPTSVEKKLDSLRELVDDRYETDNENYEFPLHVLIIEDIFSILDNKKNIRNLDFLLRMGRTFGVRIISTTQTLRQHSRVSKMIMDNSNVIGMQVNTPSDSDKITNSRRGLDLTSLHTGDFLYQQRFGRSVDLSESDIFYELERLKEKIK